MIEKANVRTVNSRCLIAHFGLSESTTLAALRLIVDCFIALGTTAALAPKDQLGAGTNSHDVNISLPAKISPQTDASRRECLIFRYPGHRGPSRIKPQSLSGFTPADKA